MNGDIEYVHLVYSWLEILLRNTLHVVNDETAELDQFDVNDFVHEVAQVVECDHVSLRNAESSKAQGAIYAHTFADLFERGIPLQLCDSNVNAIPIQWIREVFENVQSRVSIDVKIGVVAIIGCNQTSKVSLMNQLFGVNFSASSRRNGLLAQLVPIQSPAKEAIECNFLLVIDTEMINLNKDLQQKPLDRDNFICSLATCLADIVLINTNEEMLEDDTKRFLSMIAKSIQRMNEVNKSGRCYLVKNCNNNQNTSETENGSDVLFEEAENYFKDILKGEGQEGRLEVITEVFSFENKKCVTRVRGTENSFSCEYQQDPSDILALRQSILQILGKISRAPISFSGFCQRLADVAKALKSKSFVETFQDTNVAKFKNEFTKLYRGLVLKVRQELSESLSVACNDLRYAPMTDIESVKSSKLNEVTNVVKYKMEALRKSVSEMLNSTKYKCFLEQEHYFVEDIKSNKVSFMKEVEKRFQEVITEAKQSQPILNKVKDERDKFIQNLERHVLNNNSTDILEETIEQAKQECLTRVQHEHPLPEFGEIHYNTKRNMNKLLSGCGNKVTSILENKSLSDCTNTHAAVSRSDDIWAIKENFNVAHKNKQVIFDIAHFKVKSMSSNPELIVINSKKVCTFLKELDNDLISTVDSITMYLFFCSKFIDDLHKQHLKKELEALSVDNPDADDGYSKRNKLRNKTC